MAAKRQRLEHLTSPAERSAARAAKLEAAERDAADHPDDEEAKGRLARARVSFGRGLTLVEREERLDVALELVAAGSMRSAIAAFAERFKVSAWASEQWIRKALENSAERLPSIEHRRAALLAKTDEVGARALGEGDFRAAVAALALATKLAGLDRVQVEATATVSVDGPPLPAGMTRSIDAPGAVAFMLAHGRSPSEPELSELGSSQRDPFDACGAADCRFCKRFHTGKGA